jgi:hypothetical protein
MHKYADTAFGAVAALTLIGYSSFIALGAAPERALAVAVVAGVIIALLVRSAMQLSPPPADSEVPAVPEEVPTPAARTAPEATPVVSRG